MQSLPHQSLFLRLTRYTRFVIYTKYGLLLLFFIIIGYIAIRANYAGSGHKFNLVFSGVSAGAPGEVPRMNNPRLQGIDDSGRAYNITSEYAQQVKSDLVRMKKVQGDLTMKDGSWVSLISEWADLNPQTKLLILGGKANLYHDKGYEFHATQVNIDLNTNTASSIEAVEGQGPIGRITANSFTLDAVSSKIRFKGNVKLTVNQL